MSGSFVVIGISIRRNDFEIHLRSFALVPGSPRG